MGNKDSKSEENVKKWFYACYNQKEEIAKKLIDEGYHDILLPSGHKPLFYCVTSPNIIKMLIDKKVEVNFQDDSHGATALHQASALGSLETIKILVESGAKIDLKDKEGSTAFDIAKRFREKASMKYLRDEMLQRNLMVQELNSKNFICEQFYKDLDKATKNGYKDKELDYFLKRIEECNSYFFK